MTYLGVEIPRIPAKVVAMEATLSYKMEPLETHALHAVSNNFAPDFVVSRILFCKPNTDVSLIPDIFSISCKRE